MQLAKLGHAHALGGQTISSPDPPSFSVGPFIMTGRGVVGRDCYYYTRPSKNIA